ncbi:oxysterol-binding protein-related protein 6-like [Stegastes partitus]|uniref:Oxysterol-binding protein-related protein 6-like n=1 Tax=Stegastes partitus TaxID=144197 RepID=A0A9Y4TZC3_9TELE|nr:PREDICTED: oxysterol-binding protein-related protein 6-like [Stegastes partitus]
MQRYPPHMVPMDPQVCPPPLSSSHSVISGLDKSPAGTFKPGHSRNSSTGSSKNSKQSRHWEVMDDLQNLDMCSVPGSTLDLSIPGICEGYLMKRRKYPLKGWHKRYFLLEKGILKYSKTPQDIQRGKLHGSLDVSLAVMSVNKKSKRIDLDAGDNLYHLKARSHDIFYIWLTKLCAHRVFRKNEAMTVQRGVFHAISMGQNTLPAMSTLAQQQRASLPYYASSTSVYHPEVASPAPAVASHPEVTNKVSAWLQQTHDIDATSNDLNRCQAELTELAQLIQRLHWLEGGVPVTDTDLEMRINMQNLSLEKPKKKTGRLVGHSRTLSRVEAMGGMFTSSHLSTNSSSGLGASVQSIPDYVYSQLSNPQGTSPEAKKLHQDICTVSQRVHTSLKSIHEVLTLDREKLKQAWTSPELRQNTSQQLATLCSLSQLDIRTKVHSLSLSSDSSEESFCTVLPDQVCTALCVCVCVDHYEWNKVVTCIHNVLSQQRWLEHYGEVVIRNTKSDACTCKITFVKSRYWSSDNSKNEVQGVVLDRAGEVVHRFGGLWHEGIFCDTLPTPKCIWKPNVQPDDHFDFYGFSRYARELNELTPDLKAVLPPTDTRFRPDQRLLEDGKLAEADKRKDEVEEKQRERRKEMAKRGEEHIPRFFRRAVDEAGREVWLSNGTYWKLRKEPGFANTENLDLW